MTVFYVIIKMVIVLKKKYLIVLVICAIIFMDILIMNSKSYKLKYLYENPINTNQTYKDYTYNEYKDYVTILTYDGNSEIVVIPEYIKGKPVYAIDDSAFYGNTNLKKVTIPSKVIRIGHQAFIGCENLTDVDLPNDILDIGSWSFKVCTSLDAIHVKKGSKTEKSLINANFEKYIIYK